MAESNAEKKEQEEKPATERQICLIKDLYDETGYERRYNEASLRNMTRELASKHVQYLKEYKVRDQSLRSQNQRVNGFDKISHAMLFKLAWNKAENEYLWHRSTEVGFEGAMCELYDKFKSSEAAVRKHVKESGQK